MPLAQAAPPPAQMMKSTPQWDFAASIPSLTAPGVSGGSLLSGCPDGSFLAASLMLRRWQPHGKHRSGAQTCFGVQQGAVCGGAGQRRSWGSAWLPAHRDVVLPAPSRAEGRGAEAPHPFASGDIGDIWGFAPKLLLRCTRPRVLLWGGDLGALPHPARLTSPAHRGRTPAAPSPAPAPPGSASGCLRQGIFATSSSEERRALTQRRCAGKPILPENIASYHLCVPGMGRNAGELQTTSKNECTVCSSAGAAARGKPLPCVMEGTAKGRVL